MAITLRAVEPEDLEIIFQWENDRSIWHVSNTLEPFSRYTIKAYIENTVHDIYKARQLRLMIELTDSQPLPLTIGSIDLFDFDPQHMRAGVGVLIGTSQLRGKGYAGQALDELITYVRKVLMLHQLYCNISVNNEPSIRLFESKGFVVNGTKKDWIRSSSGYVDELFLQLIL